MNEVIRPFAKNVLSGCDIAEAIKHGSKGAYSNSLTTPQVTKNIILRKISMPVNIKRNARAWSPTSCAQARLSNLMKPIAINPKPPLNDIMKRKALPFIAQKTRCGESCLDYSFGTSFTVKMLRGSIIALNASPPH